MEKTRARSTKWSHPRHKIVFAILRPLIGVWMRMKFNFHGERYLLEKIGHPYLILSNHNGAYDPLMLAQSFRQPIYFVASDHIFRWGWVSRVITWLVAPIPIVKAQLDVRAIRQIIQLRQEGQTIGLFPSGNSSYTGPEQPFPPATGKLIRQLNMPVLLYRFEGGYLTTPRWSRLPRRGKMTGRVIRELNSTTIQALSPEALNALIYDLLNGDPFEGASRRSVPGLPAQYDGHFLAEYLERVLFVCPHCLQLNTLTSQADLLSCPCGFAVRYQTDGLFAPASPVAVPLIDQVPHVKAFDRFQLAHLDQLIADPENLALHRSIPFFCDAGEHLSRIERATHSVDVLTGSMGLFSDRLDFDGPAQTLSIPLSHIGQISVHGPQVLQVQDSATGFVYEIRADKPRSAYRYLVLIERLKSISRHMTQPEMA